MRPKPILDAADPEWKPTPVSENAPPRPRHRRQLVLAVTLILLVIAALVLPPLINISRYQRRISASLSASLGHPVEVFGITLKLLPRPGVQIANFVVDSNTGYSAEPILQCSSVTAAFRITSLWRGRLEIARISLDEPSLNLERAPNGEWNFASVLLQASRSQQAPTGLAMARGQNRFPYIEASNARINFKYGNEKLPFSFLNADVSIWLENPHQWQLRFAAQPIRTDINLSLADTGQVQVSGSVDRASSANELPLNLHAEWRGAPLGQVSRMLVAHDLGWRGDTSMIAHISGVPNALGIQLTAAAADFHRESFEPANPLNLHVTCTATYRHATGSVDAIHCLSPVGNGNLSISGAVQQIQSDQPQPDLSVIATHIPADEVLDLLRHTRGRLNTDMTLGGLIDGELTYTRQLLSAGPRNTAAARTIAGGALVASDLLVRSNGVEQPLPDLHFVLQAAAPPAQPMSLVLEPAHIDLGGIQPLVATARLTRQGYQLHYTGTARLQHLLPLAHAFSVVPAAFQSLQGNGTADYNLTLQGNWLLPLANPLSNPLSATDQSASLSAVSGSLSLRNADVQPSYLAEPVHIVTATVAISPADLRWTGVTATLGTTRFTGSLRIPFPCPAPCEREFDLAAQNVNFGTLAASLGGEDEGVVQELINRVRSRSQDWPLLDGAIHIAHLSLGQLEIANASADVTLRDGNLEVRSLDGRTLGGVLHATGAVDLASTSGYDAAVQLRRASAPELAQLLKEHWGPGTIDLSSDLTMRGATASDLSSSAKGMLHWSWTGGALPQLTATPLRRFDRWIGNGKVAKGSITITSSEVTSSTTTAMVTGTIGSDRSLDLKVATPPRDATQTETAATTTMSGTLAAPIIETQ
jgi:AsmA-like protein